MPAGIKVGIIFTAIAAATVTALAPVHAAPLPLDASYFADGDDLGVVKDITDVFILGHRASRFASS
jgi:hypothetical protein